MPIFISVNRNIFFDPPSPLPSLPPLLTHLLTHLLSHLRPSLPLTLRLDREIDPLSPLVTPLTYEGLISELMHTDYGKLRLNPDNKGGEEGPGVGAGAGVPGQIPSGTF